MHYISHFTVFLKFDVAAVVTEVDSRYVWPFFPVTAHVNYLHNIVPCRTVRCLRAVPVQYKITATKFLTHFSGAFRGGRAWFDLGDGQTVSRYS